MKIPVRRRLFFGLRQFIAASEFVNRRQLAVSPAFGASDIARLCMVAVDSHAMAADENTLRVTVGASRIFGGYGDAFAESGVIQLRNVVLSAGHAFSADPEIGLNELPVLGFQLLKNDQILFSSLVADAVVVHVSSNSCLR